MTFTRVACTLSIIFAVFQLSAAQTCADMFCGGYSCCNDVVAGPLCIYQPSQYTCVGGTRLCPVGNGACNNICYDQSMYSCVNGVITLGPSPPACGGLNCDGSSCCHDSVLGYVCYNPATSTCASGTRLCGLGEGVCNNNCYDTSLYGCSNNQLYLLSSPTSTPTATPTAQVTTTPTPTVKVTSTPTATATATATAPPSSVPCGSATCVNADCCHDAILGPVCYDPSTSTCASGTRLCGLGQATCNNACYDPTMYGCRNGQIFALPPSTSPTGPATCANTFCGGYACCDDVINGPECIYQPSLYTCVNGMRLCAAGDGVCGTACYDLAAYTCVNGVITQK